MVDSIVQKMKSNYCLLLSLLLWPAVWLHLRCISLAQQHNFTEIVGPLCIRSQFVETLCEAHCREIECAFRCTERSRCQAFSVHDGPCQLFVFDKCSKYVRDCNSCNRFGRVFVKQQPGLPAGALCPAGYGDDLCGTKYKLAATTSWNDYKAIADAQPGLVTMSDIADETELKHQYNMSIKHGWTALLLGGIQAPGSVEPAGGFYWASCNTGIDGASSLWWANEPNNSGGTEYIVTTQTLYGGRMVDNVETNPGYSGGLLECVSPFD